MAHPWHHAVSSARKHGGVPEDYLDLGFVPPLSKWLSAIEAEPWMMRSRRLSRVPADVEATS